MSRGQRVGLCRGSHGGGRGLALRWEGRSAEGGGLSGVRAGVTERRRWELGQAPAPCSLRPQAHPKREELDVARVPDGVILPLKCCHQAESGVGCLIKVLGRCCNHSFPCSSGSCMRLLNRVARWMVFPPHRQALLSRGALPSCRTVAEWLAAVRGAQGCPDSLTGR